MITQILNRAAKMKYKESEWYFIKYIAWKVLLALYRKSHLFKEFSCCCFSFEEQLFSFFWVAWTWTKVTWIKHETCYVSLVLFMSDYLYCCTSSTIHCALISIHGKGGGKKPSRKTLCIKYRVDDLNSQCRTAEDGSLNTTNQYWNQGKQKEHPKERLRTAQEATETGLVLAVNSRTAFSFLLPRNNLRSTKQSGLWQAQISGF